MAVSVTRGATLQPNYNTYVGIEDRSACDNKNNNVIRRTDWGQFILHRALPLSPRPPLGERNERTERLAIGNRSCGDNSPPPRQHTVNGAMDRACKM